MKKIIIAVCLICSITGCTDYYKKAKTDLELIEYHNKKLDQFSTQRQDSFVIKQAARSRFVISLFVESFYENIEKVKDETKRAELKNKFNMVYVFRIENKTTEPNLK